MDCRILRGYKPSGDLYRYIYTQILEPGHPGKVISISCTVPFISSPFGIPVSSVADPGCLYRILIFIHPGSNNSNIRQGGKNFKLSQLQRILVLLTEKLLLSSQRYGFGIHDLGSRRQKGIGSRIRIHNTVGTCPIA
jgi:hypothetical protein